VTTPRGRDRALRAGLAVAALAVAGFASTAAFGLPGPWAGLLGAPAATPAPAGGGLPLPQPGPARTPRALATPTTTAVPTTTAGPSSPAPTTTEPPPEPEPAPPPVDAGPAAAVVALTNAERARAGCGPLAIDPRLTAAAQAHSEEMAARGYLDHDSRDGRSFVDRIRAAGHPSPAAENIAHGHTDAAGVVRAWMGSPGHRRNIVDCDYGSIGVGFAGRGNYWTQNFGF
jgi:uncharacterized protein YkwD